METSVTNWMLFYTLEGTRCSFKFASSHRPSLCEVAGKIARHWGAAGAIMPPARESDIDAGARVFVELNGIENITCTPFIERRQIIRP